MAGDVCAIVYTERGIDHIYQMYNCKCSRKSEFKIYCEEIVKYDIKCIFVFSSESEEKEIED